MKGQEISNLAIDIKKVLSDYVSGGISRTDAMSSYKSLNSRYSDLKNQLVPLDQRNALGGLCYYHNIENFCIYSGIYECDGSIINHAAWYGDKNSESVFRTLISDRIDTLSEKKYLRIEPEDSGLRTALHIYPFKKCPTSIYLAVSLSSSPYFSEKKFAYFGNFLNSLFPDDAKCAHGISDIFRSIEGYINNNIDTYDLYSQIYCFHDIDNIFSHAGSQTLFDVSTVIEKQISDTWGEHLNRFTISLKDYAILIAKEKGSQINEGNRKIDFYFKSIPLPYSSKFIKLEGSGAFYAFTEALFSLSE